MGDYSAGDCSTEPTNMTPKLDVTNLPTSPKGNDFENERFGGYTVSGQQYLSNVCLRAVTNSSQDYCQVLRVYAGETISENDWMWGKFGAYGNIGMGVESDFWEAFVDPQTLTANYSIELRNSNSLSTSNVTLGDTGNPYYLDKTAMQINSLDNFTYTLTSIGFGLVQYTNGEAQSEYFSNLGQGYPVQFTLNFQGIGLPPPLYNTFIGLLQSIALVDCSSQDGACEV